MASTSLHQQAAVRLLAIQKILSPPSPTPTPTLASTPPPTQTSPQTFPFPVPNPTTPFWHTGPAHPLSSHQSTPALPPTTDILIIGSGFTSASLAYHLLNSSLPPPSITILEARTACSGATGRNGGHLKPDIYYRTAQHTRTFGRAAAIEIAQFEASQIGAIKALVEREKIDCDFNVTRAYDAILDEVLAVQLKTEFERLQAEAYPSVSDVHYLEGKAAEVLSGVKGAKCAFSFTVGSVWPYKLVMHLLGMAVERGVNLQTHTPVTHVSESQDDEGRWTISTPRGDIRAKKVVFATNGYTAGILPQYQERIIPVRGICSRIVVPEEEKSAVPSLPSSYAVRYNRRMADYQITRPDGSIIVGGGRPLYLDKTKEWYSVTDDSKLIESAVPHFDNLMQRTYRGWEGSEAKVDRIWTGIMGYTTDLMPHIGAVPSKPGQFVCAGFNGHGMPLIFLSAKGVAKMISEECEFEDTDVPAVFKTTEARLNNKANAILDLVEK